MGMGRNSSRVATRRLAKDSKDSYREGGHEEEDDDDDEWVEPGRKEMRRRRDKNSPRRNKSLKFKGDQYTDGTLTPPTSYTDLTLEERRSLLTSACGVTLSTNKICLRPTRCSAHSDHQRREVRLSYYVHISGAFNILSLYFVGAVKVARGLSGHGDGDWGQ